MPGISQAMVRGVRRFELSIEVSEMALRKYGLTFQEVAQAIRSHSLDMPGGTIRSEGGEIQLRTVHQAYRGHEFEEIVLLGHPDGTRVMVKDVARVNDSFADDPIITRFNGQPSALILVREVGNENPIEISRLVNRYIKEARATWLPAGISLDTWADSSFYLQGRINMLVQNGFYGLILVMLVLSLFLRPSLAFFVSLGIPVSFLGTFLVGSYIGLSINLISLFAFILVLGIVVDDAIVVGESVFTEFQKKGPGLESSIRGTQLVATPVTFAILTTAVAFLPIFWLPGQMGKFFVAIPLVVIPTLLFSLVQSKLVLPYHLSLCRVGDRSGRARMGPLTRFQRRVADGLEEFVDAVYRPVLRYALHRRYLTVSVFVSVAMVCLGFIMAGWVRFTPFPEVPSDFIQVNLTLPEGTSLARTEEAMDRLNAALQEIITEDLASGLKNPVEHYAMLTGFGQAGSGPNRGYFLLELRKSELRDSDAEAIAERWRKKVGAIPGARELTFNASAGQPSGLPIDIRLTGPNFEDLRAASREIREELEQMPGIFDVRDNFAEGKQEIQLRLKPRAEVLGLTAASLGNQVRSAFFGAEVQRIQRGRHELRVMVRYPMEERRTLANLENMWIRTPGGEAVPIREVADLEVREGFPAISRIDRRRVINIQADADRALADFGEVNRRIYGGRAPGSGMRRGEPPPPSMIERIGEKYPGVTLVKGGQAKEWEETRESLLGGVIVVGFLIYALLAVPFRSYLQPLIVMSVIPFGVTGAIIGHWLTGQSVSILSLLGIIALSGVVVNDSLVLVDYVNRRRREGYPLMEAVWESGAARFRPILLTSLTTFAGLTPILLERSLQAQFLIPMATSLGFGVLFATFITLILVPAIYLILEDKKRFTENFWKWVRGKEDFRKPPGPLAPPVVSGQE